jgi:hypothetical protein
MMCLVEHLWQIIDVIFPPPRFPPQGFICHRKTRISKNEFNDDIIPSANFSRCKTIQFVFSFLPSKWYVKYYTSKVWSFVFTMCVPLNCVKCYMIFSWYQFRLLFHCSFLVLKYILIYFLKPNTLHQILVSNMVYTINMLHPRLDTTWSRIHP